MIAKTREKYKKTNNIKALTKIFESFYQQVESFCQEYAVSVYEDSMKLPSPDISPPSPLPHGGYEAGHKQSPLTKFIAYFAWGVGVMCKGTYPNSVN